MTTDVEGAKRFYQPLGGWSTQPFDKSDPNNPYTMWVQGGTMIGGVMKLSNEQRAMGIPPNWLVSVQVNNVDSTVRQAESLGAKVIVPAMDIPDTGRYAVLQDPQGATIAVFSPKGGSAPSAFDGTMKVGRVSWHELMTTDYKRAFDFYRQLFGWEKTSEMDMGGGMQYFMYGMKGKPFGGIYNRQADMANVPPFWLPYIFVKDLKKSLESAKAAGAKVVNGPMDVPGGSIVVLSDPQGAAIALHQEKAAAPAKTAVKKAARTVKKAAKKAARKAAKKVARGARKAKSRAKARKKSAAKSRRPKAKAKKRRR